MTRSIPDLFNYLPNMAEIRQMEEECGRIDDTIADLQARRQRYGQLIEIARTLIDEQPEPVSTQEAVRDEEIAHVVQPATVGAQLKRGGRRRREDTWKAAVAVIVKAHPEGIAYERIKSLAPEPLKQQLVRFPAAKGFYTALRKLEAEKVVVRFRSMAFTPKGYEAYSRKVDAGLVPETASGRRGSPIEDAVLAFLKKAGPSKGPSIRADLIQYEGFGKSIIRNSSAMYNVLKRLVDRGEIAHDIEAATYRLPDGNEGPNGNAVGPSEMDEVTAPSKDSQLGLRLVR